MDHVVCNKMDDDDEGTVSDGHPSGRREQAARVGGTQSVSSIDIDCPMQITNEVRRPRVVQTTVHEH